MCIVAFTLLPLRIVQGRLVFVGTNAAQRISQSLNSIQSEAFALVSVRGYRACEDASGIQVRGIGMMLSSKSWLLPIIVHSYITVFQQGFRVEATQGLLKKKLHIGLGTKERDNGNVLTNLCSFDLCLFSRRYIMRRASVAHPSASMSHWKLFFFDASLPRPRLPKLKLNLKFFHLRFRFNDTPTPSATSESDFDSETPSDKKLKHVSWVPWIEDPEKRQQALSEASSSLTAPDSDFPTYSYDRPLVLRFAGRKFKIMGPKLHTGETSVVWMVNEDKKDKIVGETNRACVCKVVYTQKLVDKKVRESNGKTSRCTGADRVAALVEVHREVDVMFDNPGLSPFLAELIFAGHNADATFIFMPMYGATIRGLLRLTDRGPNTFTTYIKYVAEIILGISDLHDRDLVHLNLTPDNIMLEGPRPHIRICDFATSQYINNVQAPFTPPSIYTAPELHNSSKAPIDGIKADIYAFGVIFAEMMYSELIEGHKMNTGKYNVQYHWPENTFDPHQKEIQDFLKGYYEKWNLYDLVYNKILVANPKGRRTLNKVMEHRIFRENGVTSRTKLYDVAIKDTSDYHIAADQVLLNHINVSREILAGDGSEGCTHLLPGRHVDED